MAKEIIKSVLTERLAGKQYSTDDTAKWTKDIATAIKQKLKGSYLSLSATSCTCTRFSTTHDNSFSLENFIHSTSLLFFSPALNLPRYKFLVQVVIGEQKGAGVRMGCRCFWDDQTDSVASETYVNVCCIPTLNAAPLYLDLFGDVGIPIFNGIFSAQLCDLNCPQQESLFCAVSAFGVYLY